MGGHESIGIEEGKLTLTTCFSSEGSRPGDYAGELTAAFVFDPADGSFTLEPPYSITVYNPNN